MTSKVSGVSVEETTAARVILERHVRGAWRTDEVAEHDGWLILPEIPSSKEINPPGDDKPEPEEQWNDYQFDPVYDPQLPTNIVDGPWDSRSEYLKAHFEILREDAIAPLRNAVKAFKENPEMFDDASIRVYTHVYPTGILLTRNGPATRVEFSTERAAKQIRWEQSTRLMQGSMVALSPSSDNFKTICKVAIVAARPIFGGLDQNPPTIDLFWGEFNEAHIDCCEEWTMVEACEGFFEASRHMLAGLQLGKTEGIPLSTTVVKLTSKSQAPAYVKENPFFDLTRLEPPRKEGFENTLVDTDDTFDLSNVDVLQNFPSYVNNGMDTSQLLACKALLTQPVSIIQGPPGTGKTFVSIAALKVLVANLKPSDPPIIVSAQTNHALDQLLNHIMKFEPNLVRLGGRSAKDNTEIRKRTLYELREANRDVQDARQGLRIAHTTYVNLCNEIEAIVHPLKNGEIMTAQILVEHGILSEAQRSSLNSTGWGDDEDEEGRYGGVAEHIDVDLREWLGDDQIIPVPRAPNKHLGVLEEEVDLEVEQYQNLQENIAALQDDADEGLQGVWIPFGRKETGLAATGISASRISADVRALKDLNLVQPNERGRWYRGFELLLIRSIQSKLRKSLVKYKLAVQEYQVAKSICNLKIIRYLGIKVIGCTTTGLAKYRALLSALRSRTLLIEEAAETLEAAIAAGLIKGLQQLALVGDHKQLQATCNVKALEEEPYNMKISLFERLINNSIPYVMLNKQRRMVPEIRKLLTLEPEPFYRGLTDHPSVLDRVVDRPHVPGMEKDLYFIQHEFPETVNQDGSRLNYDESEMIVGFINYLVLNGTDPDKITVLTFYNGQRKQILKDIRRHDTLRSAKVIKVFTVDSYQGEENDIILLSLVRSNRHFRVGFLDNQNRVVVALSRARRGLYMFGNAITLTTSETTEDHIGRDSLWAPIIKSLEDEGFLDMNKGLPLVCQNHKAKTNIFEPCEWHGLAGGCKKKCGGQLLCGHVCTYTCHPFDHAQVICKHACERKLQCGHNCSTECGEECKCEACALEVGELLPGIRDIGLGMDVDVVLGVPESTSSVPPSIPEANPPDQPSPEPLTAAVPETPATVIRPGASNTRGRGFARGMAQSTRMPSSIHSNTPDVGAPRVSQPSRGFPQSRGSRGRGRGRGLVRGDQSSRGGSQSHSRIPAASGPNARAGGRGLTSRQERSAHIARLVLDDGYSMTSFGPSPPSAPPNPSAASSGPSLSASLNPNANSFQPSPKKAALNPDAAAFHPPANRGNSNRARGYIQRYQPGVARQFRPITNTRNAPTAPTVPRGASGRVTGGPGDAWQSFNARESDAQLANAARATNTEVPNVETTIKDTFVPVGFNDDGTRKKEGKKERVISSFDGADERDDEQTCSSAGNPGVERPVPSPAQVASPAPVRPLPEVTSSLDDLARVFEQQARVEPAHESNSPPTNAESTNAEATNSKSTTPTPLDYLELVSDDEYVPPHRIRTANASTGSVGHHASTDPCFNFDRDRIIHQARHATPALVPATGPRAGPARGQGHRRSNTVTLIPKTGDPIFVRPAGASTPIVPTSPGVPTLSPPNTTPVLGAIGEDDEGENKDES